MSAEAVEMMRNESSDGNAFFEQVVASLFGDSGFQTGITWTLGGISALTAAVIYGKKNPETGKAAAAAH